MIYQCHQASQSMGWGTKQTPEEILRALSDAKSSLNPYGINAQHQATSCNNKRIHRR